MIRRSTLLTWASGRAVTPRRARSAAFTTLVPPLGRTADCRRVDVAMAGPAQLHAGQLDYPARCAARPSTPERQRHRRGTDHQPAQPPPARKSTVAVRLRRGL